MEVTRRVCVVTLLLVASQAASGQGRLTRQQQSDDQYRDVAEHQQDDADLQQDRLVQDTQDSLTVPVRHEEQTEGGVPVGKAAASPHCPPARPFSRELCGAPACLHHHRCPAGRACCFNGCVHTCLLTVDSPPVIDWVEDTNSLRPILEDSTRPSLPVRYEDPAYASGREELVHLPGGCTISGRQYAELQNFMKAPSIEDCMCEKGEVVCAVKMFQT